jgi:uncharacterized protein
VTHTGYAGRSWLATFAAMTLLLTLLHPISATAEDVGTTATGADVVISQVYGGGGNSGATYTHDFIELFNRGDAAQNLAGWSVQYASATGTSWQTTSVTGTLQPGQYYLIQQAAGSGGTTALPTPDATGSIAMSATAGKVALVSSTTALTGACPSGSPVVNLVGFGSTASCFEGTGPTPAPSNTNAVARAGAGCTDTKNNAADFAAGAPTPRNTASPLNPCGATGADVVISQVYGGGGNSGATYTHDFIELFNRGDAAQNLAGWSVQYASATGTSWQTTSVTGTLQPGQYYLIQQAAGSGGTTALPTPDATGSIAMSATAGKVALVSSTTALTGACPSGSPVVNLVGFGSTASCFEGTGPTPAPSNTNAVARAGAGCTDTKNNAADFAAGAPTPRNTASPLNPCGAPVNQPIETSCSNLSVSEGRTGSVELTATDADGRVVSAAITAGATEGIALANPAPAPAVGSSFRVDLTAADILTPGSYPVTVTFSNDDATPQQASCVATVTVTPDLCRVPDENVTPINEIQGPGLTTPLTGQRVTTRGVVTADFTSGGASGIPANQGYQGFFIEAVEADRDASSQTSEGLFVFEPAGTFDGEIGDLVYVQGLAGEGPTSADQSVTQVRADGIDTCTDTGLDTELPPPAALPLPVAPADRASVLEPLESMRVTHSELSVVEFFQLERFGEVRLSSGGVLQNPTNVVDPRDDEAYNEIVAYNAANNIILDDGRTGQNLTNAFSTAGAYPQPYIVPGDTLRIGDQLRDHTTVLHYGFSNWRLQPIDVDAITQELRENRTRPRPAMPDVGGSLKIASFNVLNYFNGDGYFVGDETAAGFPTSRGAVTPSEFERQTAKIVAAIVAMDADVLGLIEIENDEGERQAAAALVDAINTELGDDVYDYLDTGKVGTDAIKMAYIYKPETVALTGEPAILDSSVDPRFDDTRSRPVIAQTFTEIASGKSVTVAVNHLKSKGQSSLADQSDPNFDQGDGQGFWNATRTSAAEAMAEWLAEDPTEQKAAGTLIIGDLNAYAKEDPIVALQDAGYADLLAKFSDGEMPYTYTFDATQGYLDHALADSGVLPYVTGTAAWNINADEVPTIDYLESCCGVTGNQRFRTPQTAAAYYQRNAFRSSDHDPVMIGLDLRPFPPTDEEQCKNDGWRVDYRGVSFRNQGQCVAYVVANPRAGFPR